MDASLTPAIEAIRRIKLERLKEAIAEGEADIASGRITTLRDEEEIDAFFARL